MYDANYLASRLRQASVGAEDAPFLRNHQTGETVSYGAFFAHVEKMAAALIAAGLTPGDRVAVQAPKTQAMLELYVATVLARGVFLPLNTTYTAAELSYFLNDATPRILVCDPARLEELTPIADKVGVAEVLTLAADETGSLTERRAAQSDGFRATGAPLKIQ